MHIVPKQQKLDPEQQRLLDLFERITPSERGSLLAFAEFLSQRSFQEAVAVDQSSPLEPKQLERPVDESVVKAIKRLSESYFMLERDQLLDETSSLMTSHIMQGRAAVEVIDELEALFEKHYQNYLSKS
ncbi:MAG: hypothetical protein JAY99_12650 [Candidatus Thiodiazotropha lotti]|nr:hypothetical protein [Candidatus Thiodiazotropha weberae]MCG7992313.1 hypothetical protein [Candidatus Thiodiazotropha lotti]MCG7912851.1 hypothetical protein [Candidatus Thiodiazotropha weberae]MCG8000369.1 hypothetical protein [Candidatus Thiodiazotropha lotti]MCW4183971.1 hypothetical protein [Candidatus Thiodiazotropha weberae]